MSFWEDITDACSETADFVDDHSSLIFLIAGLGLGVAATVVAVKESKEADKKLEEKHKEEEESEEELSKPAQIASDVVATAPCYIGSIVLGVAAGYCLWKSYDINTTAIATLGSALTIAERRNHEYEIYKRKAREIVGKSKEEKIAQETVKEQIKRDQIPKESVETSGDGKIRMYVIDTGTFIRSTPEEIRSAEKIIMHRLMYEDFESLYDLLYEADCIPANRPTSWDLLGWQTGAFIEAQFVPVLLDDGVTTITGVRFFEDCDDMLYRIMTGRKNI